MAYQRVYPTKRNWENEPSQNTPINATNLNAMDNAIYNLDSQNVIWDTTKANQSDMLLAVKTITFNDQNGRFTITYFNGATTVIDTLLEKIAINFDYDDNPSSAHYQNLIITLEDGTVKYIDLSALITEYEFVDSDRIHFTIGLDGKVSADVKDGSITGEKLQPNYLADCENARDTTLAAKDIVEEDKQAILDALEETEGRLLVPRGEYDPEVEYHMLDLVYDNGSSYVCKQTSTGNPTSDTDYWQIFAQSLISKMTATMTAGQTSVTFTSTSILPNSNIIVYTNVQGLMYNSIVYGTNTVTISFDEQVNDIDVQIVIIN